MRKDISGWQVRLDDARIASMTAAGLWRNETVADVARAWAASDPARITHVFDDRPYTVAALLSEAEALAGALHRRGLRPGDAIAFQLPNWVETVVIDLAAAILGLVVVPIVPIYRDAEVAFMLADCRAKAMFVPTSYRGFDYLGMIRRLASQLPELRLIASVRATGEGGDSYEALAGTREATPDWPKVDPNALKLIMYTSGTTGLPKGVLHSHNTMARAVRESFRHWGVRERETLLMASPVTHITGYGNGIEGPFLAGIRAVVMERWDAARALDLIDREGAVFSMGATPFLQELLAGAEQAGRRLPSLRLYACGGAAVPPALVRRASQVLENCRAYRIFGSSEVPLVTYGFTGEDQGDLAAETDGEVVDFEVRIVDDDGNDVPLGQEGEILARGPAMCLGYANPEQTAESFDADGYFRTGDRGHIDANRAITITGRSKDVINRGGEKIAAKAIEDILHTHPAIDETAIISMPHERLGETVCAYAVLRQGATLGFDEMIGHVAAAGVAKQKYPERLVIVDGFPRTASGKIRKDLLRKDIRERLMGGDAGLSASSTR